MMFVPLFFIVLAVIVNAPLFLAGVAAAQGLSVASIGLVATWMLTKFLIEKWAEEHRR